MYVLCPVNLQLVFKLFLGCYRLCFHVSHLVVTSLIYHIGTEKQCLEVLLVFFLLFFAGGICLPAGGTDEAFCTA